MITHFIRKYDRPLPPETKPQKSKERFEGVQGTTDHRKFILKRAYDNCDFRARDIVCYRRKNYLVSEIYGTDYFTMVKWHGLAPQFIELQDPATDELIYVNPGQLRKVSFNRRK